MSDKQGRSSCDCDANQSTGASTSASGEAITKLVKGRVPQDVHANFNLRIVPARSLDAVKAVQPQCKPRGHTQGWSAGNLGIDTVLVSALAKADKVMVAWLTKDPSHTDLFLANPVAAMAEAGVALTRAQQKALARTSEEVAAARNMRAGVDGVSIVAQVFPKGRIGSIGPRQPDGQADDFGCGPKRKG